MSSVSEVTKVRWFGHHAVSKQQRSLCLLVLACGFGGLGCTELAVCEDDPSCVHCAEGQVALVYSAYDPGAPPCIAELPSFVVCAEPEALSPGNDCLLLGEQVYAATARLLGPAGSAPKPGAPSLPEGVRPCAADHPVFAASACAEVCPSGNAWWYGRAIDRERGCLLPHNISMGCYFDSVGLGEGNSYWYRVADGQVVVINRSGAWKPGANPVGWDSCDSGAFECFPTGSVSLPDCPSDV